MSGAKSQCHNVTTSQERTSQGHKVTKSHAKNFTCVLVSCVLCLVSLPVFICRADTIYFKDGTTEKGLAVEERYDRFVFSTADGEKDILKSNIDEIFFDESYQNNVYLGKRFESNGDFDRALKFYQIALQTNPDYEEARDAVKGLEDAKWRFGKRWTYAELKGMLKAQLGITLKDIKGRIIIKEIAPEAAKETGLMASDALIGCWAEPITNAGLKKASGFLAGLSNTILKLYIERELKLEGPGGFRIFSPLDIDMEFAGPVVKWVDEESNFYKSGLRRKDVIAKIGDEGTRYMKLAEIKKKLLGLSGGMVIAVRREVSAMRKRSERNNLRKAMWVWYSKEILLDDAKRKELFEFCGAKDVGVLFFQLQYQFLPYNGDKVCRLLYKDKFSSFLGEAHSRGLIVYALDGSPGFCLEDQHPLVLAQIRAILDFNKEGLTQERFDGVHYDSEPYLLPGFYSNLKESVLAQFVSLNRKCADTIRSSGAKLDFGIDIPFWFDQLDSLDTRLIDVCDNVGIMDYRNFASGADGMIALAMDEIQYASKTGKKIFVGVETSKYPKNTVHFVSLLDKNEFEVLFSDPERGRLLKDNRFDDFKFSTYTEGNKVYLGLVKPDGANDGSFEKSLLKFTGLFGGIPCPREKGELDSLTFDVMEALFKNPEFKDIEYQEYTSRDGKPLLMFTAKEVLLSKLTFADMTEKDLNDTLAEAYKEFKNYPSFAGFAIHYYKSYKELCEKE